MKIQSTFTTDQNVANEKIYSTQPHPLSQMHPNPLSIVDVINASLHSS